MPWFHDRSSHRHGKQAARASTVRCLEAGVGQLAIEIDETERDLGEVRLLTVGERMAGRKRMQVPPQD